MAKSGSDCAAGLAITAPLISRPWTGVQMASANKAGINAHRPTKLA